MSLAAGCRGCVVLAMKRIFSLALGALAMVAVALISAFIAMRLAIHGREVEVPSVVGVSVGDASKTAAREGLNLTLENRFYSTAVPAGRILAQDPAPGSRVRRDWQIRITESLGAQRVDIPDLVGESERAATVSLRRLSLDLGAVAHLAVPGDSDVVLTQTPPANAGGVDGPRVSLLVSDAEGPEQVAAYVMPSLVGLTYSAATARAAAAGLHLVAVSNSPPASAESVPVSAGNQVAFDVPSAGVHGNGVIMGQTPQPGRRVARGDAVHVTVADAVSTTGPAAASAP
jgi:beta-lactam-binding protein with PASTA domain